MPSWPSIVEGVTKATKSFFEEIFAKEESDISTEKSRAETAEGLKAPLASPALTGTPTAVTGSGGPEGDHSTQIATDAFVHTAWENLILPTTCEAGSFTPQARIEGGDTIRFRGAIKVKAANSITPAFENGGELAKLPAAIRTATDNLRHHIYQEAIRFRKGNTSHEGGCILDITEAGLILLGGLSGTATLEAEDQVDLDGLTVSKG